MGALTLMLGSSSRQTAPRESNIVHERRSA
jgi:hypothetical protein